DDFIKAAPELVAEVSASSVSYDLHSKLNVYRRNGVREYIVWRVLDKEIDWFVLRGTQFERLTLDGLLLKSEAFPGLWLDPAALADFLSRKVSQRQVRLFGCACVRRVWHLFTDKRGRKAVEGVERYADGFLKQQALTKAAGEANWAVENAADLAQPALRAAAI